MNEFKPSKKLIELCERKNKASLVYDIEGMRNISGLNSEELIKARVNYALAFDIYKKRVDEYDKQYDKEYREYSSSYYK